MPYGDNSIAYKLVEASVQEIEITSVEKKGDVFIFEDKSFIEINKWNHRKAFLSNSWCVASV